jgi:protein KRI1
MDLLGDEDSGGEEVGVGDDASFGLNKGYAKRFEKRKKMQELSRLRQLHGDEDSEDAESEDEDAKLLTPALDLEILKTIDKIKNKKEGIYDQERVFFDEAEQGESSGSSSDDDDDGESIKPAAKRALTLKQQLLEQGAEALVSDDEDDAEATKALAKRRRLKGQLAYDEEQKKLREAFVSEAAGDGGTEGEALEEGEGEAVGEEAAGGLLRKRALTGEEADAESADYSSWLKKQLESGNGQIAVRGVWPRRSLPPPPTLPTPSCAPPQLKSPSRGSLHFHPNPNPYALTIMPSPSLQPCL